MITIIREINYNSQAVRPVQNHQAESKVYSQNSLTFEKLFKEQLGKDSSELQFSKHAAERVEQRGIAVTPDLLGDLSRAVEKARSKGAKDVVIIGQDGAFIVNIPNNIVITTMAQGEMKNNIFTNIDSAVII